MCVSHSYSQVLLFTACWLGGPPGEFRVHQRLDLKFHVPYPSAPGLLLRLAHQLGLQPGRVYQVELTTLVETVHDEGLRTGCPDQGNGYSAPNKGLYRQS